MRFPFIIFQQKTEPVFVPTAATPIVPDQPFRDPNRNFAAKRLSTYAIALIASGPVGPAFVPTAPPPAAIDGAVQSGTNRPPPSKRTVLYQAYTAPVFVQPAAPATVGSWFRPLDEPVRRKAAVPFQQAHTSGLFTPAELVTVDKWFRPFEEPVRIKRRATEFPAFTIDPVALTRGETITVDKWFRPLEVPVRIKRRATEFPAFTIDPVALTRGELVTVDKWFVPLSERLYPRRGLGAHLQRADFATPFTQPPVPPTSWFSPLSEPVRLKRRAAEFPAFFIDPFALTRSENITVSSWFIALGEPVRVRPALRAALQMHGVMDPGTFTPEKVTVDRWLIALSEPVRVKRRVPDQPANFWHIKEEVVTLDKWYVALSEPVRLKVGLGAHLQLAFATDPFSMTLPETVFVSAWFATWRDPRWSVPQLSSAVQSSFSTGNVPPPAFVTTFAVYAPMCPGPFAVYLNTCNDPLVCEDECT